ncbi:MAG: hypothetical protein IPO32_07100 [Crocinitomicaceae bacterium]|nr:hypothetical protein [Crocinitomicaceae bacterium]
MNSCLICTPDFFSAFLIVHIIGGGAGLISGTLNLILKKGGKIHKIIGQFFFFGMLVAGLSALILSFIKSNHFLFIVGVFTLYMVITGKRYIYLKLLGVNQKPALFDWMISLAMVFAALVFLVLGVMMLIKQNNFGIVLIVFGIISFGFVRRDFSNYRGQVKEKNYWLLMHLQRMTGAYIASATAFLVVNAKYIPFELPAFVFWLLPTAVLTPLIVSWSNKYSKK